jgi:hypothetical protein
MIENKARNTRPEDDFMNFVVNCMNRPASQASSGATSPRSLAMWVE